MQKIEILKRLLVLFTVVTYVIIPFVDSIACDDCKDGVTFQGGLEINYIKLLHTDGASRTDKQTSNKKETKAPCSLCFNTAEEANAHNSNPLFTATTFVNQAIFAIPLEPLFSTDKPPQN